MSALSFPGLNSSLVSQLHLFFEDKKSISTLDGEKTALKGVVSLGLRGAESDYNDALQELYNICIAKDSSDIISVKRTCDIFATIFQENTILSHAREHLNSPDKFTRSQAKKTVKNEINAILSEKQDNDFILKIKEVNNNPRLVETHYALSQGVKTQAINVRNSSPVFIMYDRNGPVSGKALAIFKECPQSEIDVEVEVCETLRESNKINVKHTTQTELEIEGSRRKGIFQKFIKGEMIREREEPTDQEAIDQIQLIGIFDLINLNFDRNNGNFMIDRKGKVWAIDHAKINIGNPYEDARIPMIDLKAGSHPFSPRLIDHIKSLNSDIHVSESVRSGDKLAHVQNIIEFLKWAVSDDRKFPLTLNQIYNILYECVGYTVFDNKDYNRTVTLGLSKLLTHTGEWGIFLRGAFPEIDATIAAGNWDSDLILEKSRRLKSYSEIKHELCLDLLLENGNSINEIDTSKLRHLNSTSIIERFEQLAHGTKYYDEEKRCFTPELSKFLQRLNVEGVTNDLTPSMIEAESRPASSDTG
jgi:hypothetical protein